jgi:hypothetical protein
VTKDYVRLRTAWHESAHAVVAYVLRRPIRLVSIRRGEHYSGIMINGKSAPLDTSGFRAELPAIVQPARVRRFLEAEILISLAGDCGTELVWPAPDGYGFVVTEDGQEATKVSLQSSGLSRSDAEYLATVESDQSPLTSDDKNAGETTWALAGSEALQYLGYMRAVTRRMVWAFRDDIAAVADELLERDAISGQRVRELLREREVRQW